MKRWLKRVWEGLRRALWGEVGGASPPLPREAEIEAEMVALEARVLRLLGEVRGARGEGEAETAGAGRDARAPGDGGETARADTTPEGLVGGEGDLRKALEEEIWERGGGRAGGGRDDGVPTAGAGRDARAPGDDGEAAREGGEACAPGDGGETAGEGGKACAPGDGGETAGAGRDARAPGDGGETAGEGEGGRVVLRGVPQGICGQMTGRAGGAQLWEGVL